MQLTVTAQPDGDVTVVELAGDVDVYTAPKLRSALDEELGAGHHRVVIDLEQVAFLDSTALGVLVARQKFLRSHDGWLRIVATKERILSLFTMTGLTMVFGIYDSVSAAIEGKDAPDGQS